ncbi:hypothetical protein PODOV032v1_p0077 [Vibrio phage 219E41.1]|nr:hypothetical protein PODOV021v1_p0052 [Vibrio phage 219E41.2]QZI91082.1 hypothetical protein PODOV032v1_p0077 [Vibrio phage 219E41.1]
MDKTKLYDELTEMFIGYQWRLDNPMQQKNETPERIRHHYMTDYLFHNKVKQLVSAVMLKVEANLG